MDLKSVFLVSLFHFIVYLRASLKTIHSLKYKSHV